MKQFCLSILAGLCLTGLIFSVGCKKEESSSNPTNEPQSPQSQPIKIGAILPLTGDAAKYGKSAKEALDMAVDEINSGKGVRGSKVEIIYEDDSANPTKGVSAINKLISVDHVPAVIGALPSSVTLAIAPVAENNKVVLLSPMSSNPKISDAGDYIFRNCISDLDEGSYMAEFAINTLHIKRVAILYINNDYGTGLNDVFSKKFQELGGQIVDTESFLEGRTDFRSQISKIKDANPEAIYLVGYTEMIQIFKQLKELAVNAQVLSTIMLYDPELVKKCEGAAEGAILTAWEFDSQSQDEVTKQFVERFKARYGHEPDVFAAQTYDTLFLLKLAIEGQGTSPQDIRDGLYSIKDFPGVSGKTTFTAKGDVIKPVRILKVQGNEFVPYPNNK